MCMGMGACVYTTCIVRLIVHLNKNNIFMLLVRKANRRGPVMFQMIGLALFSSGLALYSDNLSALLRIPDRGVKWKTSRIFPTTTNKEPKPPTNMQDIEKLGVLMLVVGGIIIFIALLAMIGTMAASIRWRLYIAVYMLQSFIIKSPRWNPQHSTAQHSTAQHSTAQHSTAQHSTAQHSTAQHSTAQHSTAQHSTAQHSTAQHSTAQHSTAQHSTAQHSTAQHSTAQHTTPHHTTPHHSTALHCTALHCTALHCTALHCTALHCTALHCTALHCTAQMYCSIIIDTSNNSLLLAEHKDNPRHC